MLRILFICAKNQWRSPTAAHIFKNDPQLEVRSAGLSKQSPTTVSAKLIEWAEIIMVMEKPHAQRIRDSYQRQLQLPEIISLDIPDDYPFMDPDLIELLKDSVAAALEAH